MRHALEEASSIRALPVGMIGPAFRAGLVATTGASDLLAPGQGPAPDRAVPVAAIAAPADVEVRAASRTAPRPKLLHPTPPAEEVSTGDPSRIIISSETKRLHPRGASEAAEAPVSSTGRNERQAADRQEPVSGLPGSRATPRSPRSSARGLLRSSPGGGSEGASSRRPKLASERVRGWLTCRRPPGKQRGPLLRPPFRAPVTY